MALRASPRSELFKLTLYYWRRSLQMWVEPSSIPWTHATGPIQIGVSQTSWVYDNLSPNPASSDYYERRVNGISRLIRLLREANGRPPRRAAPRPHPRTEHS